MKTRSKELWQHAISRPVLTTAIRIALVVGTILALINHGPSLLEGQMTAQQWLQIALTYLVPYCVSTYSSVKILLEGPGRSADSV